MRHSLRLSIVGTFGLLLLSLCLVGLSAISIASRSGDQVTRLEQHSLVPAVGLGILSQSLDQERSLLSDDALYRAPAERRAILDELADLDTTITRQARHSLETRSLPRWTRVWKQYIAGRAILVSLMRQQRDTSTSPQYVIALHHVSNRLDAALDSVQRDAGNRLHSGDRLYAQAVAIDGLTIRLTIASVAVALLFGLLLVLFITARLTRGLRNLTGTAEALRAGKLDVRADEASGDELSVVAQAFNHMTDSLLQLEHAALTDVVTGLGNHRAFQEEFSKEVARSARYRQPLALALIDLDDFKVINDQHGHSHGDRVLAGLGHLLRQNRVQDLPFRVGGDEFALLMPQSTGIQAGIAMERLRALAETELHGATLSIGVAELAWDEDHDSLREQADAALYEAKRRGRNTIVTFDVIKQHTSIISSRKITNVRRLLAERQLTVAFQPIWHLNEHALLGYEALMRPAPKYELNPAEAFDIAEKLGRGPELDALCREAILARAHELPLDALLFINLSPQALDHPSLEGSALVDTVKSAGIQPWRVVLEITERSIGRVDMVVREAERLRGMGFQIALDDVGAGNAGLEMLRRVPVDYVKLDRSVVTQALVDETAYGVLSGIIAFARRTRTFVIAEGIETQEMLDVTFRAGLPDPESEGGVQGAQGYLLGRPNEMIAPVPRGATILPFRNPREAGKPGEHAG